MKKSRFTDKQIAYAVQQAEAGIPVGDIVRKYGISQATLYRWRKQYGGLAPSELQRLKQLEAENRKLRKERR